MRWRSRLHDRTERGASAVEFALVVIPLLMIIAGIVNFGFVFAQQLALDNAVRAGARAGVVPTGKVPATVATTEWTNTAIGRSLTTGLKFTYPGAAGTTCKGSQFGAGLALHGEVDAKFMIPWPAPDSLIPQSVKLTSQAEFQCEYQ